MKRWLKYKYLQLLRARGGSTKVAKGFSLGLFVEMFTLPTFGVAFFLIFPLIYLFRASLAGALIGFVFGKIIYIPMAFMNSRVGGYVVTKGFSDNLHDHITFLPQWLENAIIVNLRLIVGGMIDGVLLGLLVFFPIKWLLMLYTRKRLARRRRRKLKMTADRNGN